MFVIFILRGLILLLVAALLPSCAQVPGSVVGSTGRASPAIGGLLFDNHTTAPLTEVRLVVLISREFVACGYVPPRGQCSTTFPLRRYQGNEIQVSWVRGGQSHRTRPFVIPLSEPAPPEHPLDVVIGIGGPAGFSAVMRPASRLSMDN